MTTVGDAVAHYRLEERIERPHDGRTMAFRAVDEGDAGRVVMLEVLNDEATSVEKARFATRARRLRAARHTSLFPILDVGPTYCAFELPSEESLGRHAGVAIARARQKLAWLSQVASGLAAVHRAAMVHGHFGLRQVFVSPDTTIKIAVPLGGDVSGSPLDDVRAFGMSACELVLGQDTPSDLERAVAHKLQQAGLASEAAAVIARVRAGASITSDELAEKLVPFAEYAGPSTEPLLPIVPRR